MLFAANDINDWKWQPVKMATRQIMGRKNVAKYINKWFLYRKSVVKSNENYMLKDPIKN